jgi:predicted XRE-type DNA-binding protein
MLEALRREGCQQPARLTPKLAARIKRLAIDTNLMQHEIAELLKLNQGRMSEVLTSKRFGGVPPAANSN